MGMGIHGEPGVWNGPLKTSREIAEESLNTLLTDMPVADCEEVSILINGLGATSIEELYILSNDVTQILNSKGIKIYKTIRRRICNFHGNGRCFYLNLQNER